MSVGSHVLARIRFCSSSMGCGTSAHAAQRSTLAKTKPLYSPAIEMLERAKSDPLQKELLQVFLSFDTDANGLVGIEEFREGLLGLGQKLTETETRNVVNEFDYDGDGWLNLSEFEEALNSCADDVAPLEASPVSTKVIVSKSGVLLGPSRAVDTQELTLDDLTLSGGPCDLDDDCMESEGAEEMC